MTYGQLATVNVGWVLNHVIGDMVNNEKWGNKNWKNEPVSDYDMRTIREKSIFFKEPVPAALEGTVA